MKRPGGPRPRASTTVGLSSLVVIAALTLAACGGSTTTASSPPTSPSASSSQVAASPSWQPTRKPAPIPAVKVGQKLPPFAKLAKMFAYDTPEPLDFYAGRVEQ